MKAWWEEFNNPLVKGVTGFALCLFLALNFPVVFLTIVAAALCYAVAPVGITYAYRSRKALEERERRKLRKREQEERLRRYKLERNRRKREHGRRALEQR